MISERIKQMIKSQILLDHGSGGRMSHELIASLILPAFQNDILSELHDGAAVNIGENHLAFSTDTYVVDPLFFPGGNIGDLAINGTVNDISMCGASPLFLSVGLVLEEGLPVSDLDKILKSMRSAADAAGIMVVTGDTKVVPKNAVDKIFINTSGIGLIPEDVEISSSNAKPGDKIILSGSIADHGMTILIQRESMAFESNITSDTAPLNHLVSQMLSVSTNIHVFRDPTRGGVGTALNEIAEQSKVGIIIDEKKIPVRDEVSSICELLGFDPLYVANEGKLLAFVPEADAEKVLAEMRNNEAGKEARIIGAVIEDNSGKVLMRTRIDGTRVIDMLTGEQLPRIC
jgi:hydrogenase expression/formation protein HypE